MALEGEARDSAAHGAVSRRSTCRSRSSQSKAASRTGCLRSGMRGDNTLCPPRATVRGHLGDPSVMGPRALHEFMHRPLESTTRHQNTATTTQTPLDQHEELR
jgi:hypothetical protein